MSKALVFGFLALVLVSAASAETCFTAVNVPESNKEYWKAVTYTGIEDAVYDDYLTREDVPTTPESLGPGYQYQMRMEKNCFDGFLLSNLGVTGITSSDVNIQERDDDYFTSNFQLNRLYTVSVQEDDAVSTKLVSQVTTGVIEGTDYLALPDSFTEPNKHPEIQSLVDGGLCKSNLKLTQQLQDIRLAVWDAMEPTTTALTCNKQNVVDCALASGQADSELYAATAMVLARTCGVPARVAHGVSEGSFDGVDIYYNENKMHYWLEFYDNGWHNFEVVEAGPGVPEGFEYNCVDNVDNDGNGAVDCEDFACFQDRACELTASTSSFANEYSTSLSSLPNHASVNNLTLGNQFGSVAWINQGLDLRGVDLDSAVVIKQNQVDIHNTVPELNAPATVTIRQSGDFQKVLRGNEACSECEVLKNDGPVVFTIPGAGSYGVEFAQQENNTREPVVTNPQPDADEGLITKYVNKVTGAWESLTGLGKGVVVSLFIVIGYLWWRRKRRRARFHYQA